MKRVTIQDVADTAGVSKSTVSQFLNKRYDYMGSKTKEKIEAAIEELGYHPNIVARSLKQKSTTTIGVIIANILHEFSTHIIRAIEDECNELGFHIIVCNADDDLEKEKKYMNMLMAKQVDGIIALPTGGNIKIYEEMNQSNFPIVFLDRYVPQLPIHSILLNNEKASLLAVEEFVKHGYRQIGFIIPSPVEGVTPRIERLNGLKRALELNGLDLRHELIRIVKVEEVQLELEKMLALKNPPDAILALNDRVLIEILKYTKKKALKIPEDIALIGIDDVSFASFYYPSITTVAQPTFEMGKAAAKLLLEKIMLKENPPRKIVQRFEPKLIARDSC